MFELISAASGSEAVQGVIVFLATSVFSWLFTARGRLVWSYSHQFLYLIPDLANDGRFPVRTQQSFLQNSGQATIEGIEAVLNYKPQHYEVWPVRDYQESVLPDGRLVLSIPNLARSEAFTITMLDTFKELPVVVNVRWSGGFAEQVSMAPQRVFGRGTSIAFTLTALIGASVVVFAVLQLLARALQ